MGKNLTSMIAQVRAAKGEPVLITSLTRRNFFSNGTVNDILGPWADGMIGKLGANAYAHIIRRNHPGFERTEDCIVGPSQRLRQLCAKNRP